MGAELSDFVKIRRPVRVLLGGTYPEIVFSLLQNWQVKLLDLANAIESFVNKDIQDVPRDDGNGNSISAFLFLFLAVRLN